MASEWVSVELQTILELGRSISYGVVQPGGDVTGGVPIIRVSDVRDGRINTETPLRISPDIEANYVRTRLRGGELLLTLVGTVGETAVVSEQLAGWNTARAVAVIPVNKGIGAYWVRLALTLPEIRHRISGRVNTTVQTTLNLRDVAQLPVVLPPDDERKRIEQVIAALDDKIELNRRMNETLEAMARALFQSWFVDFDPVRAKAAVRREHPRWTDAEVCRAALPNLSPEIAALFPDSFEHSALGEIPTFWSVNSIGDLVELAYGKSLKETDRKPGNIAVYGSNGQIGWHNEKLVEGPGIIVGRKGNPGIVTWVPANFFAIDTTFYVIPKTECRSLYFLFYALKEQDLVSLGADSAVPGLNRNMAYLSKQLVPSSPLLAAFDHQIRPLFDRIQKGKMESSFLAQTRDTLLPKLISGELCLENSERLAEKTT